MCSTGSRCVRLAKQELVGAAPDILGVLRSIRKKYRLFIRIKHPGTWLFTHHLSFRDTSEFHRRKQRNSVWPHRLV